MKPNHKLLSFTFLVALLMASCRKIDLIIPSEYQMVAEALRPNDSQWGMYLVNEGNMGSNKSSIDYLDYTQGIYIRNLYAERNPDVVKELGDVGNDIQIYGSRLYVVVNCSHKVEVMEAFTGKRLGQVDIPNCRYIRFHKGKAYVSSYIGPVQIDPQAPLGAVFEVDTASMKITRKVLVGYQPEEMEIIDELLYVANSGGYRSPNYDNTVSVVRLDDLKQIRQIPVGINLHRLKQDRYGKLWVSSRGNHEKIHSNLFVLAPNSLSQRMEVTDTLNVSCSNMALKGDSLYYYSTEWNSHKQENTITYGIINVKTKKNISSGFITDGNENKIKIPYGIAIHPDTGEIYITDATNYVSSGRLLCFSSQGKLKWSVRTGDIPAHMVFLPKQSIR